MDYISQVSDFVEKKVRELGFELYKLEIKDSGNKLIVRVFIDRKDRFISIQDCVFVSRGLEKHLEELIPKTFLLEVSSPGADRELRNDYDFERFKGMQVEVIKKDGGIIRGKLMGKIQDEVFVREESKGKEKKGKEPNIISVKIDEIEKVKLCP